MTNKKSDKSKLNDETKVHIDEQVLVKRLGDLNFDSESNQWLDELSPEQRQEFLHAQEGAAFLEKFQLHFANESVVGQGDSTLKNHQLENPLGADASPDQVGRFQIKGILGQGGFGFVYLAFDPHLKRLVALKVPNLQAMLSQDALARFDREAKAAAILTHSAIVPVFESGVSGAIRFIAYKYCQGTNLANWLNDHRDLIRSNPRTAANILLEIAEGVQHAHQRGVIHRDIKPANILIESGGESFGIEQMPSMVRIADFGLARYVCDNADVSLTQDGGIVGTPAYMSPEQARGDRDISEATDIFSLGQILYELLTGKTPHRKPTPLATLQAIQEEVAIPPRQLNGNVHRSLEAICLKCLKKETKERYQSCGDLVSDLRAFLDYRPVSASHVTIWNQIETWTQRHRVFVRTAFVGVVLLAIGFAISSWMLSNANERTQSALKKAELEFERAEKNRIDANNIVEEFFEVTSDELFDVPGFHNARERLLEKANEYFTKLSNQSIEDSKGKSSVARAKWKLAGVRVYQGRFAEAVALLEDANEIFALIPSSDVPSEQLVDHVQIDYLNGLCQLAQQKFGECRSTFRQVVENAGALPEPSQYLATNLAGLARKQLADLASNAANDEKAMGLYQKALLDFRLLGELGKATKKHLLDEAAIQLCLAKMSANEGDVQAAKKTLLEAERLLEEFRRSGEPSLRMRELVARSWLQQAELKLNDDEYESAIDLGRRAVEVWQGIVDSAPKNRYTSIVQFAYAVDSLTLAIAHKGDNQTALDLNQRTLDQLKTIQTANQEFLLSSLLGQLNNNRALFFYNLQQYDQSILFSDLAIAMTKEAINSDPTGFQNQMNLANHHFGKAEALRRLGQYQESIQPYREAKSRLEKLLSQREQYTEPNIQHIACCVSLGRSYAKSDQLDRALELFRESTKLLKQTKDVKSGVQRFFANQTRLIAYWFDAAVESKDTQEVGKVLDELKVLLKKHPELFAKYHASFSKRVKRSDHLIQQAVEAFFDEAETE